MSLLSRSQLRAALTPGGVILVRTAGFLKTEIRDVQIFPVEDSDSGKPWEPAAAALKSALASFARRGEALTVVLSNHFSYYTVVPALPSLANDEEDAAFARYTFREVFGEGSAAWTLRVSGDSPDAPRLASAIDEALLASLRRDSAAAGVQLVSVQPYLMTAYNAWASELGRGPVWFALYEPGRLCISLCTAEGLQSVRGCPAGETWRTELPLLLDRETRLQELEGSAAPTEAFVFHPSQPLPTLARTLGEGLRALSLAERPLPDGVRVQDAALALVGL